MAPRASVAWLALALIASALVGSAQGGLFDRVRRAIFGDGAADAAQKSARPPPAVRHADGVQVVDLSDTTLPPVRVNHRVVDLVHGGHFDALLQDTPDELRPPAVVLFFDPTDAACDARTKRLNFDLLAEENLPARERLLTARYDMHAAPRRAWYKFTPELDLAKRFKVTRCPEAVFVPRNCSGWTRWCSRGADPKDPAVELMGCEDFEEQCTGTESWDEVGELGNWIKARVRREGEPQVSSFLGSYKEQGEWIKLRDRTTTHTQMRNLYLSQAFPAFTPRGFKAMPVPEPFMRWLESFYERHEGARTLESWDAGSTQMSFHETPTSFVALDREAAMRDRMANQHIKPIVERWSGMRDLELTAFYGMREYPDGSWLRNHVDRIDTHVLSVTIAFKKLDPEAAAARPWPLEVIDFEGNHVRYEHPGGTMVLYESSKLPHGRPFRNLGGTHVGCFIHFKPRSMHSADAGKWDAIVSAARRHAQTWSTGAVYRSRVTDEPEEPVEAATSYGEGSTWRPPAAREPPRQPEGILASFKNAADRALEVYWQSPGGAPVMQAHVAASVSFQVKTYPGHTFFFSEPGEQKPLPGGTFTVEPGREVYKFAVKREVASRWAPLVRAKFEAEGFSS